MAPPLLLDPDDAAPSPRPPPLASLTLSAGARTAAGRPSATSTSSSSGARSVRSVPALRRQPGARAPSGTLSARAAASHAASATASSTSSGGGGTAARQAEQQGRAGGLLRAWRVPLAAAGLVLHVAGAAAKHVFAPGGPGPRQQRRVLGDSRVFPSLLPKRIAGGGAGPPGAPGGRKPALVWFRNDLRLHDHEPLAAACAGATSVLPVYVFDPREYAKSPNGFDKTGPYRARFILEALSDLRDRLRDAGSDLVLRIGRPEDVLPQLCRAVGAGAVYCHGEVTAEEGRVEGAVARALDKAGAALKVAWGGTLFHLDDLPFQLPAMPPHYSEFRRAVRSLSVRSPVAAPSALKGLPAASVAPGDLPTLQQLGFDAATLRRCAGDASAAGAGLRGGESEALRRLSDFVAHFSRPPAPAAAAGSAPESNFCCKISPWLALGCLSPRQLYDQLQQRLTGQRQQQARAAGEGSDADMQWLLYELLWRDFFRFVTKKYATAQGLAGGSTAGAAAAAAAAAAPAAPALAMA